MRTYMVYNLDFNMFDPLSGNVWFLGGKMFASGNCIF